MGSYETMAQMRLDPLLNSRIQSCVIQQAQTKPDSPFVEAIKTNSMSVVGLFVPLMTTDQIFSDAYEQDGNDGVTDQMILAGVQANWDGVESMWRRANQPVMAPRMTA